MKIYEPNVAFYICKGAKNKKHKADLLESIKIANSTSTEQKSVSS